MRTRRTIIAGLIAAAALVPASGSAVAADAAPRALGPASGNPGLGYILLWANPNTIAPSNAYRPVQGRGCLNFNGDKHRVMGKSNQNQWVWSNYNCSGSRTLVRYNSDFRGTFRSLSHT